MAIKKVFKSANESFQKEVSYLLKQYAIIQQENEKYQIKIKTMKEEIANIINY